MSDYISSLTGQEMDIALQDMAMHNSEAYAIGERNGITVNEGDPTYHNNARYYAQIATSQVEPGNIGDAVRWDTDQTSLLSAVNKAQARANILAGGTNVNLLDNPFFSVNQRSATTITGSTTGVFSVDRWRLFGTSTSLTVTSTGVSVCSKTNGFAQRFDDAIGAFLNGKTVTLSAMDDSGNIASGSLVYDNTTLKNTGSLTLGSYNVTLYAGKSGAYQLFSILTGENTINLCAVKLELGSYSTLANDAPPDYGTELAKCQRYFVRALGDPFGTGYITTAGNNSRITVPVPMTMRATPTVSFSGTFHLRVQGNTLNVTTMSTVSPKNTAGGITLSCSGFSGATTGFCALYADGMSDYIDFSADL